MKTPISIITVCLLAFAAISFAAPSTNTTTAAGKISAVKKSSITIATGDHGTLKSFKITKKTKIKVNGKNADEAALKSGMEARVTALELPDTEKDKLKDKEATDIEAHDASAAASTPDPLVVPAPEATK